MAHVSPLGGVYQAGTLSGNPVAMAAGLATLTAIQKDGFHHDLATRTSALMQGFESVAEETGIPLTTQAVGGMFGVFFTEEKSITSFSQVMACDVDRFRKFYHGMLDAGVYMAPSAFEAGFMSAAHTDNDISATLDAARSAMKTL